MESNRIVDELIRTTNMLNIANEHYREQLDALVTKPPEEWTDADTKLIEDAIADSQRTRTAIDNIDAALKVIEEVNSDE